MDPTTPTKTGPTRSRAPLAYYANYFEVGHNPYEFLVDFGQFQPDAGEVVLHTRIAVGPTHAKLLSKMLEGSVRKYEDDHGSIADVADSPTPLEVVMQSLPEFERRAVDARREGGKGDPAPQPPSREKR